MFFPYSIGFDEASSLRDAELGQLISDHYLVVIDGVEFSDKKELIRFAGRLGNPIRYSLSNMNRDYSAIEDTLVRTVKYDLTTKIHNGIKYTGRAAWHIDTKWTIPQIHIKNNLLYGRKVPTDSTIGNTIFSHTGLVFADMPAARQEYLRSLTIKHVRSKTSLMYENGYVGMNISDFDDNFYMRSEPLIQRDQNGKEFIFLSEQDAWRIDELGLEQGRDLIQSLAKEIRESKYLYRHCWQPNQLLISVNPVFMHAVTDDFDDDLREMWRIWIK